MGLILVVLCGLGLGLITFKRGPDLIDRVKRSNFFNRYLKKDLFESCEGFYEFTLNIITVESRLVQRLLPTSIKIDSEPTQRVLVFSGAHTNVGPVALKIWRMRFKETYFALSNAILPSKSYVGPYLYIISIYLDQIIPVIAGYPYGFIKLLGRYSVRQKAVAIKTLRNKLVYENQITQMSDWKPMKDYPHLELLKKEIFKPYVGRGGIYSLAAIDLDTAEYKTVSGRLEVPILDCKSSYSSMSMDKTQGDAGDALCGGLMIRSKWLLTSPDYLGSFVADMIKYFKPS